jgi:hypothetical protein
MAPIDVHRLSVHSPQKCLLEAPIEPECSLAVGNPREGLKEAQIDAPKYWPAVDTPQETIMTEVCKEISPAWNAIYTYVPETLPATACVKAASEWPACAVPSEWLVCVPVPNVGLAEPLMVGMVLPQQVQMDYCYLHSSCCFETGSAVEQVHAERMNPMQVGEHNVSSDAWEIIQGRVWSLAKTSEGCRQIQKILEDAESDSVRALIACELRGHVWDAIWSPHANHVIQKCISTLRPCESQFIIDEILQQGPGAVVTVAAHQYGCRILQRLLEHFPSDRLQVLIEDVLCNVIVLSKHIYGSFFIQHLLEHGDASYVTNVLQTLTANVSSVAFEPPGVTVLGKALTHAPADARESLANALASQPRWLVPTSAWRHGFLTAKLTLEAASPSQRDAALKEIMKSKGKLRSRYGRKLMALAEEMMLEKHK